MADQFWVFHRPARLNRVASAHALLAQARGAATLEDAPALRISVADDRHDSAAPSAHAARWCGPLWPEGKSQSTPSHSECGQRFIT
jgi:hypothetical protein